jgi:hypothetical protein
LYASRCSGGWIGVAPPRWEPQIGANPGANLTSGRLSRIMMADKLTLYAIPGHIDIVVRVPCAGSEDSDEALGMRDKGR